MIIDKTTPIESLVGYYECEPDTRSGRGWAMKLSYDRTKGVYWIQTAYRKRPEQKPRAFRQRSAIRSNMQKYIADGFKRVAVEPANQFQPIEKLAELISTPAPAAAISTVDPVAMVSELTVVEGETVLVRDRVLKIQKGEFNYVPQLDSNYFFTELTNDVIDDLQENQRVLLSGHTGCGKTSLFSQIAARINQPVVRANMNGQTTVGDFVGMWAVNSGGTYWVDGILPLAMKNGWWLIIDEIDCADASILAVMNSVLEKGGSLTLKEKGHEVIVPHENFRILATANSVGCMANQRSLYQGTNIMNEAFLDRWRVYHSTYLPATEETKVLKKKVSKISSAMAEKMVKVANSIRTAFEKEEISCTFSFRRLQDWAELTVRHSGDYKKAAQVVIYSKISKEDRSVIEGLLARL